MNIEFHHTFVAHFQQQRLANLLIRDIGALHDLTHLQRLFAERAQDIFSIIQHDYFPPSPTIRMMMTILSIRGYLDL
jgi:hypothetical protein